MAAIVFQMEKQHVVESFMKSELKYRIKLPEVLHGDTRKTRF